jgi:hypothetical protein
MDDDPTITKYRRGSASRRSAERFAGSYTALLRRLNQAFDGKPRSIDSAFGTMYEMRLLAHQALQTPAQFEETPFSSGPFQTGLSFDLEPPIASSATLVA